MKSLKVISCALLLGAGQVQFVQAETDAERDFSAKCDAIITFTEKYTKEVINSNFVTPAPAQDARQISSLEKNFASNANAAQQSYNRRQETNLTQAFAEDANTQDDKESIALKALAEAQARENAATKIQAQFRGRKVRKAAANSNQINANAANEQDPVVQQEILALSSTQGNNNFDVNEGNRLTLKAADDKDAVDIARKSHAEKMKMVHNEMPSDNLPGYIEPSSKYSDEIEKFRANMKENLNKHEQNTKKEYLLKSAAVKDAEFKKISETSAIDVINKISMVSENAKSPFYENELKRLVKKYIDENGLFYQGSNQKSLYISDKSDHRKSISNKDELLEALGKNAYYNFIEINLGHAKSYSMLGGLSKNATVVVPDEHMTLSWIIKYIGRIS